MLTAPNIIFHLRTAHFKNHIHFKHQWKKIVFQSSTKLRYLNSKAAPYRIRFLQQHQIRLYNSLTAPNSKNLFLDSTKYVTHWVAALNINHLISWQHQTKAIHFINSTKDLSLLWAAPNITNIYIHHQTKTT